MKTTVEIPDALFRRAKAAAAHEGVSFRELLIRSLTALLGNGGAAGSRVTGWRSLAGSATRAEARRINAIVEAEFERVDPADWR